MDIELDARKGRKVSFPMAGHSTMFRLRGSDLRRSNGGNLGFYGSLKIPWFTKMPIVT